MKTTFRALCAVMIVIAAASCKNNNDFVIKGTVKNPGTLKKIYLLQTDTARISVVDSTNLGEGGKFQFKRSMPYANLFRLRVGGSVYDLIARNGDEIEFSTDLSDEKHTYEVKGSQESAKIQEFNKLSNSFSERSMKLTAEYQARAEAAGKESDTLMAKFIPRFKQLQADYSNAVLKYVNDNKSSLAAFYAAASLELNTYEAPLVAYADDIKGKFTDNPAVQHFVKQMETIKPISVGHTAPDFTIGSIDGKPIKLSDYKGKYVMIDFWASWCGPCKQEMPNVVKQYSKFKSKGFNILGVSLDEERQAWTDAVKGWHMTWPQASELQSWKGPVERLYHIEAIPSNFIIDPKGTIVAKNVVGTDLEEFLNKTFAKSE